MRADVIKAGQVYEYKGTYYPVIEHTVVIVRVMDIGGFTYVFHLDTSSYGDPPRARAPQATELTRFATEYKDWFLT